MSKKCNVICVVGPGFPFADPINVADLSANIGEVLFFTSARTAFEAVRDEKIPYIVNAIVFTDHEAEKISQHLHTLVQKCEWEAAKEHVGDVFSVTTGNITHFVSGEKIHSLKEFIANLDAWVETSRIPKATSVV